CNSWAVIRFRLEVLMSKCTGLLVVALWLVASVAGADEAKKTKTMSDAQLIKLAMSAGPADISKDTTIKVADEKMNMRQLKAGTNGWMCMAVQAGALDTMCLDKEWQGWADAYVKKTAPQVKGVGVAYMLAGDHGVSNTDPYAEKPTPDNNWIVS